MLVGAVTVVAVTVSRNHPESTATSSVVLAGVDLPGKVTIGVIVTFGDDAAEGAEWRSAAEGARVAQERLRMGGTEVSIITSDDRGTVEGAREAVAGLVERGVSGIVVASSGEHLSGALLAAAEADTPVVMPFASPTQAQDSLWTFMPEDSAIAAAVDRALVDATDPLVLDAGEGLRGVPPRLTSMRIPAGEDLSVFAAEVAGRTVAHPPVTDASDGASAPVEPPAGAGTVDAIVVTGPPTRQASVVEALRGAGVSVRIVLSPTATSPSFASALSDSAAIAATDLVTIGGVLGDAAALESSADGRAMSAYLSAVRVCAEDDSILELTGEEPFASVAAAADARSHDAVIALIRSVAAAKSVAPSDVGHAMRGLRLGHADGIAGPALDFSDPYASIEAVDVLSGTGQHLGLRPGSASADGRLVWFIDPTL